MKAGARIDGPLKGIRVLDLADEKASFCSRLLADIGAQVIKIEKPGGDPSRERGPFWKDSPHPERSLFFWYHNTNKLGITLNLEKSAGKEIFCRLIKKADIAVETFPSGYLDKLRLGFEVLSELNPRIILVSVTGFGQHGPRRYHKSCDLVASAMGGQMYVSGSRSTSPLKPFGEQSYYAASLFAAIGALLALRKRNQSGEGAHLDISLQEAVISSLDHVMIRYFYDHVIPQRQGGLSWNSEFCILPSKDGFVLVTLFQQWKTLVEWMASDSMAEDLTDEKWDDEEYRRQNRDHIIEVVRKWTRTYTTGQLFEMGQLMRFPWAPVHTPREVIQSPQLKARGFFIATRHPEIGASFEYPGFPYKFRSTPLNQWRRAPLIGEDNARIFEEEFGLTKEEIKRLSSLGAI